MRFTTLKYLILSDLYRYKGDCSLKSLFKNLLGNKGFFITIHYRIAHFLYINRWQIPYLIFNRYYLFIQILYGIELPPMLRVGPGFRFTHVHGTIVSHAAVLGRNLNLSHQVTIGVHKNGIPTIGDNVVIAPGTIIAGPITIGAHAHIGAQALVLKDVPEKGVMVGSPARELSRDGSFDVIRHTDYDRILCPPDESEWDKY